MRLKVPGEANLYWEHPDGNKSVRIVHVGGKVIGVNLMGMRWRHAVCERWIQEERDLAHVLPRLAEAGFDPELHRRHEREIAAQGAA